MLHSRRRTGGPDGGEQYFWRLSPEERWRNGLPLKRRVAIWYENYEALFDQSCDILVIHDAPPPHRYGQQPFADLAEAMPLGRW